MKLSFLVLAAVVSTVPRVFAKCYKDKKGWKTRYYNFNQQGSCLSHDELESRNNGRGDSVDRIDQYFDFNNNFGLASYFNDFMSLWATTYYKASKSGTYRFQTESDDGSLLYVDDKQIVNNDGDHGMVRQSGSIYLTAGKTYKIDVTMYEHGGGEGLRVWFEAPGSSMNLQPEVCQEYEQTTTTSTATSTTSGTTITTGTTTTIFYDVTCEMGEYIDVENDLKCTECPDGKYVATSVAGTTSCKAQPYCDAGEGMSADTKSALRTCKRCAKGQYQFAVGKTEVHRKVGCETHILCPPGEEHKPMLRQLQLKQPFECQACAEGKFNAGNIAGEVSMNACQRWKVAECNQKNDEVEITTRSAVTDRLCARSGRCTFREYESQVQTATQPRLCSTIGTCSAGRRVSKEATKTSDLECVECEDNYYQSEVDHRETECIKNSKCGKGAYSKEEEVGQLPVGPRECTECPGGQYQKRRGHSKVQCDPQPGCGVGLIVATVNKEAIEVCTPCPLDVAACPPADYPETTPCKSTYQPNSEQTRNLECIPNTITTCGENEYMANRESSSMPQSCVPCSTLEDGDPLSPYGSFVDLESHSLAECVNFNTQTSTATSTPSLTATTTASTTPATTATTTPATTATTQVAHNLVIFSVAGQDSDLNLFSKVFYSGDDTVSSVEAELEAAITATYPTVLRVDDFVPNMAIGWVKPPRCTVGEDNCFECQKISHFNKMTPFESCVKCANGAFLHEGECVDECPSGFEGRGTGNFGRRCADTDPTGSYTTYARKGIVATLIFKDGEEVSAFEAAATNCEADCVKYKTFALCPRTRAMGVGCGDGAAEASSVPMAAVGGGGAVVLLLVLAFIFLRGGKKGHDDGYGGYDGSEYDAGGGGGANVAFENPMYDNNGGNESDDSTADTGGLYDEPETFAAGSDSEPEDANPGEESDDDAPATSGVVDEGMYGGVGEVDVADTEGMYENPVDNADGYLDIEGDDESAEEEEEEEEEEESEDDDE